MFAESPIIVIVIDFLDRRQTALILNVEPVTISRLIARGELSAVKVGRVYRIATESVLEYLKKSSTKSSAKKDTVGV